MGGTSCATLCPSSVNPEHANQFKCTAENVKVIKFLRVLLLLLVGGPLSVLGIAVATANSKLDLTGVSMAVVGLAAVIAAGQIVFSESRLKALLFSAVALAGMYGLVNLAGMFFLSPR